MTRELSIIVRKLGQASDTYYAVTSWRSARHRQRLKEELWVSRDTLPEIEAVAAEMIRSEFPEEPPHA